VLELAEIGNNAEVDMLVSDIYGGNYDQMNLKGSMVASNFGKLVMEENPREGLNEADLAISLLMMITNNIGQVAYLNAMLHGCKKIFFVGNFLRNNAISLRRLAFAISFWSKGTMEAMFLEHEGYFGALGSFLESAFGETVDNVINVSSVSPQSSGKEPVSKPKRASKSENVREYFDKEGAALHFVASPTKTSSEDGAGFGINRDDDLPRGRHRTVSMTGYSTFSNTQSPRSRHGNLRFSGEFQRRRKQSATDDGAGDNATIDELTGSNSFPDDDMAPPPLSRKRTQSLDSYAHSSSLV
jgi:type II pantothenate kinase